MPYLSLLLNCLGNLGFYMFLCTEMLKCGFNFEQRLKECAISVALSVGLITGVPAIANANINSSNLALPDVSVLISGPPIKDPSALLRYALPINNKAVREVQKPLEDITDSLKVSGVKALDSVERVSMLTS